MVDVDHEIATRSCRCDHACGAEHVEDHLLRRAGFQAGRSRSRPPADDGRDGDVSDVGNRRARVARTRRPVPAPPKIARVPQRADDIGGSAAHGECPRRRRVRSGRWQRGRRRLSLRSSSAASTEVRRARSPRQAMMPTTISAAREKVGGIPRRPERRGARWFRPDVDQPPTAPRNSSRCGRRPLAMLAASAATASETARSSAFMRATICAESPSGRSRPSVDCAARRRSRFDPDDETFGTSATPPGMQRA